MYAAALALTTTTVAATTGLPFFHSGTIFNLGGLSIESFGAIVAAGVLIGAALLRRYAEWHGISDDHIRALLGWVTICGFLGAHEFDVIAYNWHKLGDATVNAPASWWFLPAGLWPSNWPLPLRFWDGISSYGGFIGGAGGYAFYVWWKRLPVRLLADTTLVGLLPAFSIGRIGCTVVSDHIGAAVDPSKWYAFLAMDYPRDLNMEAIVNLVRTHPGTGPTIRAWNLGLIELLYLIPVNAVILWLAFRPKRRPNAGFVVVLAGILYAPVRFLLDFLRPEESDPRYFGMTFAQYASILLFGVAVYAATRIARGGKPADVVAPTSGDAQRALRMLLHGDDGKPAVKPAALPTATVVPAIDREPEDKAVDKAAAKAAAKLAVTADDNDDDDAVAREVPMAKSAPKAGAKPGSNPTKNKNKKKR